ncbi:YaaR family protein [Paenalkalicoccus suaedae]|uniref:YaaR family protein n=1 Tax=Paenalkalicoccus suaedae TaxID=2592382 RepID=A0A859FFI3_9BACI|nr:YaaR family protein [Paenalkalicoccus suaedae]QKS70996.1 YaaR family protein [Paenalkalicoccus suaedae]
MEVNRVTRAGLARQESKQQPTEAKVTFKEIMQQGRNNAQYERLGQLLEKIDDQGKVLYESRTVDELRKYKQLVKDFMDDAVKLGLNLEENKGFNRRGRTKVYKIVREVDSKLIDLTNAVLHEQKKSLDILNMVGEIRGLLVNIYA